MSTEGFGFKGVIIVAVVAGLILIGTILAATPTASIAENNSIFNSDTPFEKINLKEVASMRYLGYDISVDLTTGVLYYNNLACERMTVLVNADGTPKNINQFISQEEFDAYVEELNKQ